MQVSSLSSGCEIAQFFVRHTVLYTYCIEHTKPLDPRRVYGQLRKVKLPIPNEDLGRRNKNEMQIFDAFFKVSWPKWSTHALENRV